MKQQRLFGTFRLPQMDGAGRSFSVQTVSESHTRPVRAGGMWWPVLMGCWPWQSGSSVLGHDSSSWAGGDLLLQMGRLSRFQSRQTAVRLRGGWRPLVEGKIEIVNQEVVRSLPLPRGQVKLDPAEVLDLVGFGGSAWTRTREQRLMRAPL